MATNHLRVNQMRDELRERLERVPLRDGVHIGAGGINGPDDDLTIGPGLALDFGSSASRWGTVMWNDHSDTWDIAVDGRPGVYKASTVDDAYVRCVAAGKECAKRF